MTSVLYNIVNVQPPSVLEADSDLPQEIQEILDRALAKSSADRFQTAGKMASEVEKLLDVYRKSFPRLTTELQRRLDGLERLSREEKWTDVIPLAQNLVQEHPELELPQRMLRRALREISREEKERLITPEERTRHLAEISQEFKLFYGASEEPTIAQGVEPSLSDSGASSLSPFVKVVAGIVLVALLAVVGWLVLRPREYAIRISSEPPGASIIVNGQNEAGLTNADGPVEVIVEGRKGDEVFLELHLAGYVSIRESFTLDTEPPPPLKLTLEPLPRKLEVVTDPPGATVHLDGQEIAGTTPMELELAPREEHELVISKEEYTSQSFTIGPGEELPSDVITLSAIKKPGTLAVRSSYPLSVLSSGGRGLVESASNPSLRLEVGRHQIVLRAPEVFLNRTFKVEIREAATTSLEAPGLGKFSVRALPENCSLTINGLVSEPPPV